MEAQKTNSAKDIQNRHSARQRRRRRNRKIRRTIFSMILITITIAVIMFMTPVFNIQSVKTMGNKKVTNEQIHSIADVVVGQNLFKVNLEQLKTSVSSIAYLNNIHISRVVYPPSLKISVTECVPVAFVNIQNRYAVVNKDFKVLEISYQPIQGVPEILGLKVNKYDVGNKLGIDESNKFDIIILCIQELNSTGLISKVASISAVEASNISFAYDNRLDVTCGGQLDFSKKISLFKEVVTSDKLPDNSRGTIDLSTTGKAIYMP